MATRSNQPLVSVEVYMQLDQTSDTRYEYWDGQLVAMSGGIIDHGLIARNIEAWIETRLDRRCRVHRRDVKLRLSASKYVLPDVHSTCDPGELRGNKQTIRHPKLIFEVLSPGTESTDRGEKLEWYRAIPTMRTYVLVNYHHRPVEI